MTPEPEVITWLREDQPRHDGISIPGGGVEEILAAYDAVVAERGAAVQNVLAMQLARDTEMRKLRAKLAEAEAALNTLETWLRHGEDRDHSDRWICAPQGYNGQLFARGYSDDDTTANTLIELAKFLTPTEATNDATVDQMLADVAYDLSGPDRDMMEVDTAKLRDLLASLTPLPPSRVVDKEALLDSATWMQKMLEASTCCGSCDVQWRRRRDAILAALADADAGEAITDAQRLDFLDSWLNKRSPDEDSRIEITHFKVGPNKRLGNFASICRLTDIDSREGDSIDGFGEGVRAAIDAALRTPDAGGTDDDSFHTPHSIL